LHRPTGIRIRVVRIRRPVPVTGGQHGVPMMVNLSTALFGGFCCGVAWRVARCLLRVHAGCRGTRCRHGHPAVLRPPRTPCPPRAPRRDLPDVPRRSKFRGRVRRASVGVHCVWKASAAAQCALFVEPPSAFMFRVSGFFWVIKSGFWVPASMLVHDCIRRIRPCVGRLRW
jgi:hypothetical protein